jgi:hypothetical protein
MTASAGTVAVVAAGDRLPDPHAASTVADAATPAALNQSRLDKYLLIDRRLSVKLDGSVRRSSGLYDKN